MANSSLWNGTYANISSGLEAEQCTPWSSTDSKAMRTTAYIVQFIFSLSGNVLVIAVLCKSHQLRNNPVNLFIVNMAVSDLLVPLFVFPRRLQEVYLGWGPWLVGGVFGDIFCKVANFADELSLAVSSLCMLFIASERFWLIFLRKKVTVIYRKNTPKFIVFMWIFSCLFYSFYFFAYKLVKSKSGVSCVYDLPQVFDKWEDLWRVDRMGTLTVFGIIPFIAMTFSYIAIMIKLIGSKRLIALRVPPAAERKREKQNKRTILMLITIVLIFFVAWIPYCVYIFNQYFSKTKWSCKARTKILNACMLTNYIYTILNPMIYYLFNKRFRQGVHKILFNLKLNTVLLLTSVNRDTN